MRNSSGFILPFALFGMLLILTTTLLALQPVKTSWRLVEDYQHYLRFQHPAHTEALIESFIIPAECAATGCTLHQHSEDLYPISVREILIDAAVHSCDKQVQILRNAEDSLLHSYTCDGNLELQETSLLSGNFVGENLLLRGKAHDLIIDGSFTGTLKLQEHGTYRIIVGGRIELANIESPHETSLLLVSTTDSISIKGLDSSISLSLSARKGFSLPSGAPYRHASSTEQSVFERLMYYRDPLSNKNS